MRDMPGRDSLNECLFTRLSRRGALAGVYSLPCGLRFDGAFAEWYPTLGTFTDAKGAQFTVNVKENTLFTQVEQLGDAAFKSKTPLEKQVMAGLRRNFSVPQ
jgi:hypothetical protein